MITDLPKCYTSMNFFNEVFSMQIRQLFNHSHRRRHWLSAKRRPPLTSHWRQWLCQRRSLTESLRRASEDQFSVRLLSLQAALPNPDEAALLGIPTNRRVLIREVELIGKNQVWVYARTVIPDATLRVCHRHIYQLGNRSLGSMLFSNPAIQRGTIEVSRIQAGCIDYPARRSRFYIKQHPLLVTEVFLPIMADIPFPE